MRKWSIPALGLALALALALTAIPAAAANQNGGNGDQWGRRCSDVSETHWAREDIGRGVSLGFVDGFEDGTFRPSQPVSNAQFCAMVARVFCAGQLEDGETDGAEDWWAPYVRAAWEAGLLEGTTLGGCCDRGRDRLRACADESISRYDMARILCRLAGQAGESVDLAGALDQAAARIADWAQVPEDCRGDVAVCYALGLLNGLEDGAFGGRRSMDRAQACVVICRVMDLTEDEAAGPVRLPQQPSSDPDSLADEVVRLVNELRAEEGLAPLAVDDSAARAAQVRAEELTGSYDHTRPDGRSCFTALDEAGASYWTAGENIAAGYSTAGDVVAAWMDSPGHRANILSGSFTKIGVGYFHTDDGYRDYWVQMFLG